jgi:hypothetical protein
MNDLRDKEPEERLLDFVDDTFGSTTWQAILHVWTYSGIRNEDVYPRKVIVRFRAERMRHAMGFAESIATTIKAAHDVWETGVDEIRAVSE